MGRTGEPTVDADVDALVDMVLPHFADGLGPTWILSCGSCRARGGPA